MRKGFPLGHLSEAHACGRWGVSVTLPDDQGFHEEIQLVLLGTHLRQRLGTEGRRPLAAGGLLAETVANRDHWPNSGPRGPAYLYRHLQGARVVGHSRHLTFIHLPKRTMAQTPVQRRRPDEV